MQVPDRAGHGEVESVGFAVQVFRETRPGDAADGEVYPDEAVESDFVARVVDALMDGS